MHDLFLVGLSHGSALMDDRPILTRDRYDALMQTVSATKSADYGLSSLYLDLLWKEHYLQQGNGVDEDGFASIMQNISERVWKTVHFSAQATSLHEKWAFCFETLFREYIDATTWLLNNSSKRRVVFDAELNEWSKTTNAIVCSAVRSALEPLTCEFFRFAPQGIMTFDLFCNFLKCYPLGVPYEGTPDVELARAIFDAANVEDTRGIEEGVTHEELEIDEFVDALLLLSLAAFGITEQFPRHRTIQSRVLSYFQWFVKQYNSIHATSFSPPDDCPRGCEARDIPPVLGVASPQRPCLDKGEFMFLGGFNFMCKEDEEEQRTALEKERQAALFVRAGPSQAEHSSAVVKERAVAFLCGRNPAVNSGLRQLHLAACAPLVHVWFREDVVVCGQGILRNRVKVMPPPEALSDNMRCHLSLSSGGPSNVVLVVQRVEPLSVCVSRGRDGVKSRSIPVLFEVSPVYQPFDSVGLDAVRSVFRRYSVEGAMPLDAYTQFMEAVSPFLPKVVDRPSPISNADNLQESFFFSFAHRFGGVDVRTNVTVDVSGRAVVAHQAASQEAVESESPSLSFDGFLLLLGYWLIGSRVTGWRLAPPDVVYFIINSATANQRYQSVLQSLASYESSYPTERASAGSLEQRDSKKRILFAASTSASKPEDARDQDQPLPRVGGVEPTLARALRDEYLNGMMRSRMEKDPQITP